MSGRSNIALIAPITGQIWLIMTRFNRCYIGSLSLLHISIGCNVVEPKAHYIIVMVNKSLKIKGLEDYGRILQYLE